MPGFIMSEFWAVFCPELKRSQSIRYVISWRIMGNGLPIIKRLKNKENIHKYNNYGHILYISFHSFSFSGLLAWFGRGGPDFAHNSEIDLSYCFERPKLWAKACP